jgi:hypothetical protein
LLDRKYCNDNKGRLKPTEDGMMLWDEVTPFYNSESQENSLFSTSFTSRMESDLDQIETGVKDSVTVWDGFVSSFRDLHEKALEMKKERPTRRQIEYYERLASLISDDDLNKILDGRDPLSMDGEKIGEIIDGLKKATEDVVLPASAKQLSYIENLVSTLELDESAACKLVELERFDELTGGKSGTASSLISKLREKTDSIPRKPSPKQLNFIKNLVKKAELEEKDACKLIGADTYSDLSGGRQGTASKLIETLRKRSSK